MSPTYIGTSNTAATQGKLFIGSTQIRYAYIGNTQVFPFASPDINPKDKAASGRALVKNIPLFSGKTIIEVLNPINDVEIF